MKIEADAIIALEAAQISGNRVVLTGQLDRKLYASVNQVLEAAGGKWSRRDKAHIFPCDAIDALDPVFTHGSIETPRDLEFFPTPPDLVQRVLDAADIRPGHLVLEPSAGDGALAKEAVVRGAVVDCVELGSKNFDALVAQDLYRVVSLKDFLTLDSISTYDRVVMNPPFGKQADVTHILHALTFLKPGGKLAAIASSGVAFRENRKTQTLRDVIAARGGTIAELPAGSFKGAGTMVNTVLVTC